MHLHNLVVSSDQPWLHCLTQTAEANINELLNTHLVARSASNFDLSYPSKWVHVYIFSLSYHSSMVLVQKSLVHIILKRHWSKIIFIPTTTSTPLSGKRLGWTRTFSKPTVVGRGLHWWTQTILFSPDSRWFIVRYTSSSELQSPKGWYEEKCLHTIY